MPEDALTLPADQEAVAALAADGLRYGVVDRADAEATRAWFAADVRGFHGPEPTSAQVAGFSGDFELIRAVGVWDVTTTQPELPVATVASWPAALTLPGGEVTAWAISSVTVAPTHRRRGIARMLLEAELRAAVAAGCPVAALTVSEATIYGRFGFGPSAFSTDLSVDVRRAGWLGPGAPGRVRLVSREQAMDAARALLPVVRRASVGDVEVEGQRFDRLFGRISDDADLRSRRFLRYDDAAGDPQGIAVYALTEDEQDFTAHTLDVKHLASATDDAYRALWRFLLEMDLVHTVTARLRAVDEPLRWLVRDQRAIRTTEVREHLWVRVLDPAAAFGARRYRADGRLALRIADPLGYAAGEWLLTVADGAGALTAEAAPADVAALDVPADLLGPLLLGGVPASVLARAGRITQRTPGDAAAADVLLGADRAPWLATWF